VNRVEHLLVIANEEAIEIAKEIDKALRFGPANVGPGEIDSNADLIIAEYADLCAMMDMLVAERIVPPIDPIEFAERVAAKKAKVENLLLYSRERGTLQ
jgi:hypothetical protein